MIKIFRNEREVPLTSFTFNGGEEHVRVDPTPMYKVDHIVISARLKSSADIMQLLLVTDAVKRCPSVRTVTLKMPYIPYARQDRVCNEGEAHSLKVFCNLINQQGYDKVQVLMPHSDVATALLENVQDLTGFFEARLSLQLQHNFEDFILVSPDAGALKRTFKLAKYLSKDLVTADKVRDTGTGQILKTEVYGDVEGKTCVIYDDICDGGMTFIKLAEALREKGAEKVVLVVAHGIFSKGLEVFDGLIDHIFTTDSWTGLQSSDKLTVINI